MSLRIWISLIFQWKHLQSKFFNGLMHGEGQFQWACGLKYKGPFHNNSITGFGTYQWADGSWYKGQLLNGKRHGKGQYFCSKDKSKYNGQWKLGIRHGHGLLQFNQQTSYEGQFYEGVRQGKGKMKYSSGNVYQGQWKNDKKCGYGIMNWFTENEKYQGEWLNDLQHGLGTYYWYDGKIQYKIIKNIYKGYWKHGQRQGYGSFFYSNGCRYEGYFDNNQKQGEGIVMDQNGNIKLEYFQKDRLISSIPEGNVTNLSLNKAYNNSIQKKQKQILPKLNHSKTQPNSLHIQNSARPGKLPSVQKSSSKQNNSNNQHTTQQQGQFPQSNMLTQKQAKLKIEQNIYTKCLDIPLSHQLGSNDNKQPSGQRFVICKDIMNLLLRQNSHIRQWYKHCSLTASVGGNNSNSTNGHKDFYTGVTIQNMIKLIKDLKIIDDFLTVPKINRQFFYEGWKSNYDVALPNQKKLNLIKQFLQKQKQKINHQDLNWWEKIFNNQTTNYSNIQWHYYTETLQKSSQNDLSSPSQENIDLNFYNDIHNPKKIILYRHFVCYLLRIAYLQTQKQYILKRPSNLTFQKSFRQNLQKLFKTINGIYQLAQRQAKGIQSTDNLTFVSKQKALNNISQEYNKLNQQLFHQITKNYQNINNHADSTVTVKLLYQLLQKFGVLKQPAQKILFLQKIQRFMESQFGKHSLLRKQLKSYFPALEKVIYTSPYFNRILNYSLIQKQFQQLLYLAVNRKINSNCKEQTIRKYRQVIQQIITFVKKEPLNEIKHEAQKQTMKMKRPMTLKDKQKIILIEKDEQRKAALKQAQRKKLQLQRQQIQRSKMQKQDFRWEEEDQIQDSDEYFD